jgi:two-component system, NarL family, invasion response regulator UvrY
LVRYNCMDKKRILVADDHSAIRMGIKNILTGAFANIVIGEAVSADDILSKVMAYQWDLLILDINIPGKSGIEILRSLREIKVKVPVLIFTMHPEDVIAIRALRAGASGFLSKSATNEELIAATEQLLAGRKYISHSVAELLTVQIQKSDDKAPHERLSDREFQTMMLLAAGQTVSQIAATLGLSTATVSTFRSRILTKMNVKNNAGLTQYVIQNNLAAM